MPPKSTYNSIFDKIKRDPTYTKFAAKDSIKWFRSKLKELGGVQPKDIIFDAQRSVKNSKEFIGKMFFYTYDPKWKAKLKYYDTFPLVLPIEIYGDGFLGLNLHYLSPMQRAYLLSKLMDFASDDKLNSKTKLEMSYALLKGVAKYKEFLPTVHRYLWKHVKTKFTKIDAPDWETAIFLPVARFKKANQSTVWKDSQERIYRGY